MPIIASEGEKKSFHLTPAGNHLAVCFNVWDLGLQKESYQGEEKTMHKIIIGWEIDEVIKSNDEYDGKRYCIYKKYTLSLGEKANLNRDLVGWRGKPFTDEEKKGFDVEKLVGVSCLLSVVHSEKTKEGRVYANISGVSKLPKGMSAITPENKRILPDWIKKLQDQATGHEPIVDTKETAQEEEIPF